MDASLHLHVAGWHWQWMVDCIVASACVNTPYRLCLCVWFYSYWSNWSRLCKKGKQTKQNKRNVQTVFLFARNWCNIILQLLQPSSSSHLLHLLHLLHMTLPAMSKFRMETVAFPAMSKLCIQQSVRLELIFFHCSIILSLLDSPISPNTH